MRDVVCNWTRNAKWSRVLGTSFRRIYTDSAILQGIKSYQFLPYLLIVKDYNHIRTGCKNIKLPYFLSDASQRSTATLYTATV